MREEVEQALRADGDRYHVSNHEGIGTIADPAFDLLKVVHSVTSIASVLEIGCTTGFRLEKCRQEFGARCAGLEISPRAVAEGRELYPDIDLHAGVAPRDLVTWTDQSFDVITLGHFLYLLPREDLFSLAAEVDRLLMPGGHLIVMDFFFPHECRLDYHHNHQLEMFKGDPSRPWTWSPTYTLVARRVYDLDSSPTQGADPRSWQTVDLLRKHSAVDAYPMGDGLPSRHAGDG